MVFPMYRLSIMRKESVEVNKACHHRSSRHHQSHFSNFFSLPPEAKACMPCKEEEMSWSVSDNKVHSVCFVCLAAASFAAASALAFPVDTKSLLVVCAAHLQMAICLAAEWPPARLPPEEHSLLGCPSDLKKILCEHFHSAQKSCVTPNE